MAATKQRKQTQNAPDASAQDSARDAKAKDAKTADAKAADVKAKDGKSKDAKAKDKAKKNGKPGLIARLRQYISDVRAEVKRVIWPSKQELVKYTICVIAMLIFFGILIFVADAVIVPLLYSFSGLRG